MPASAPHESSSLDRELTAGVHALGLAIDSEQQARLIAFVALLGKWNKTYNLTAIREPARMITHHLLDVLAVLPHLPRQAGLRLLDVGSGGGVPGIPLAIARPDWRVVLVDSSHKKATFARQAAIELKLANVDAQATRIEDHAPDVHYDVVISRAFSDLATFAALAEQHLAPNGLLVAMKGVHPDEELAELPSVFAVVGSPALKIPGIDAARHLIIMQRASEVALG